MALITRPNNFTAGTIAVASQVNSNENTMYNEFNGNIDNDNIKANAGIVDTKLAQITTSNKVSTTALTGTFNNIQVVTLTATNITGTTIAITNITATNLSGITIGNMKYADTRFTIGSFTRDISTASGSQAVTGIGFTPVSVDFIAVVSGTSKFSIGFDNVSSNLGIADMNGLSTDTWNDQSSSIYLLTDGSNTYAGKLASLDANGFTVSWTKAGSPTGTAIIFYRAYR